MLLLGGYVIKRASTVGLAMLNRSRLSMEQNQQVLEDLLAGPAEFGYRTQIWTTRRIAEVIEKPFGIVYHRDHVGRLIHSPG